VLRSAGSAVDQTLTDADRGGIASRYEVRVGGSDDAVILVAIYVWVLRIELKRLPSYFRFPAPVTSASLN
jgi:hypothetical protein